MSRFPPTETHTFILTLDGCSRTMLWKVRKKIVHRCTVTRYYIQYWIMEPNSIRWSWTCLVRVSVLHFHFWAMWQICSVAKVWKVQVNVSSLMISSYLTLQWSALSWGLSHYSVGASVGFYRVLRLDGYSESRCGSISVGLFRWAHPREDGFLTRRVQFPFSCPLSLPLSIVN